MCLQPERAISYVGELPAIDCEGGVLTVNFKSGTAGHSYALPLWLVRLIHKRIADLLASQDAARAA